MKLVILGLLTFTLAGATGELPVQGPYPAVSYRPEPHLTAPPVRPVAEVLAAMPQAKKTNARLQLLIDTPEAREAETAWNAGGYDHALELIRALDPEEYAIAWREPVRAPESDWGTDVLVSARDSVIEVELDVHHATGHLFCVTRYLGDGVNTSWAVNMSTDGGMTWAETYRWGAGYEFGNLGAVCQGSYVYIGFPRAMNQQQAFLYRCRASDGQQEDFPGGREYMRIDSLTGPVGITEVEMTSNADSIGYDNRLYYALIDSDGGMRAWWIHMLHLTVNPYDAGVCNLDRGLDIAWNQHPSLHYVLFSGIDPANEVRLYGAPLGDDDILQVIFSEPYPSVGDYTGLSAWKDTFVICIDYQGTNRQAQYLTSYEAGIGHWFWGAFGDTLADFTRSGDVCCRLGDGEGVAFWQFPQEPWGLSYTWRDYAGSWIPHQRIQDQGTNTFSTRIPDIRRIEPGVWGVAFIQAGANGMALFDRTVYTGVRGSNTRVPLLRNRHVSVASGTYRLPGSEPARLYDRLGREAARLLPGENDISSLKTGVYFLRTDGRGSRSTCRVTVIE